MIKAPLGVKLFIYLVLVPIMEINYNSTPNISSLVDSDFIKHRDTFSFTLPLRCNQVLTSVKWRQAIKLEGIGYTGQKQIFQRRRPHPTKRNYTAGNWKLEQ
jgi:hypothetical protein